MPTLGFGAQSTHLRGAHILSLSLHSPATQRPLPAPCTLQNVLCGCVPFGECLLINDRSSSYMEARVDSKSCLCLLGANSERSDKQHNTLPGRARRTSCEMQSVDIKRSASGSGSKSSARSGRCFQCSANTGHGGVVYVWFTSGDPGAIWKMPCLEGYAATLCRCQTGIS